MRRSVVRMAVQGVLKKGVVVAAVMALIVPAAVAQDITSPNGDWRATIDPNFTGQITNLFGPWAPATDNLFESLWYEASTTSDQRTIRVEQNYTAISQNIGDHSATFQLRRNDGLVRLDVLIEMLDGASGGAQYELWYTNESGEELGFKPFVYVDYDVGGSVQNLADWLVQEQALEQSNPANGKVVWLGGKGPYKSWQIGTFSGLRTLLDDGVEQLTSSGGGGGQVADWTAAIAGQKILLGDEDSLHFSFGMGGAGIPEPATLGLLLVGGLVALRRRR